MDRGTLLAAGTAALVLFGAACGDDDTTNVARATSIRIVSGCTNASAGAGLQLADPVVVEVLDQRGNPMPGVAVTFTATTGGGSASPTTATTNAQGQTQTLFTLGTSSGANVLTATAAGVTAGATCNATGLDRFVTALKSSNEPTLNQPAPNATGNASVVLSGDEQSLTVTVNFSGLTGNAIAAHIHGPFTPGATGSAGVILGFPSFPAATSGTYTQTFTKGTATVGGGLTWEQLIDLIKTGRTYVNVHTPANGGGEIRGQLARP